MNRKEYTTGMRDGMPVAIGYFAVSFGFGALAVSYGLKVLESVLISFTNFTSAGQVAGLLVIVSNASLWEMALTQLVINSRYCLMSLALGQKMGKKIGTIPRLAIAFFNSDEVFALAMARSEPLTTPYLFGLATLPMLGWSGGTLTGALASTLIPPALQRILGVALYGMFVVIVVPQAKQQRSILFVVVIAALVSSAFHWLPLFANLSSGLAIVIATLIAAVLGAVFFPVDTKEEAAA